jgi:hypothetical protein
MALVPFARLLALMADKLEWTQQLGNAFLAQQTDVMNAVQALRHDAMAAGYLKASPQCHCVIQTSGNTISILPSESDVVCIPAYNPRVVYGTWPALEYPPYFFPIPAGIVFYPGYSIGFWPVIEVADFGPLWGWWSLDWGAHAIDVDHARYAALDSRPAFPGNTWVHDPAHRGGVAYSDPAVRARFDAARSAAMTNANRGTLTRGAGVISAGRFGGSAAAAAGRFGGVRGHTARANFAAPRMGSARLGGGPHFSSGGHIAHANFGPARMGGGGPHFGGGAHGGGGAPHGAGGGGHGGGRH